MRFARFSRLAMLAGFALPWMALAGEDDSLVPPYDATGDGAKTWQMPTQGYLQTFGGSMQSGERDGAKTVLFTSPSDEHAVFAQTMFEIPSGAKNLQISFAYRAQIESIDTTQNYFGPRIETYWWQDGALSAGAPNFPDTAQRVEGRVYRATLNGSGGEWQEVKESVAIPSGTAAMSVRIGLINTAGTLEIGPITVHAN